MAWKQRIRDVLLFAGISSLALLLCAYEGGQLKNHGHSSAVGDGGTLSNLTVGGFLSTPGPFTVSVGSMTVAGASSLSGTPVTLAAASTNSFQFQGASTGNNPLFQFIGGDATVNGEYDCKTEGCLHVFDAAGKTASFEVQSIASGADFLIAKQSIAGSQPKLSAAGSDTNVDINLIPKGTGIVEFADAGFNSSPVFGFWAKSQDGVSQSSGTLVVLDIRQTSNIYGPSNDFVTFTSTTTSGIGPIGILLDNNCAPGSVCRVGMWGIMQTFSTNGCVGSNAYLGLSGTRGQASSFTTVTSNIEWPNCLSHPASAGLVWAMFH